MAVFALYRVGSMEAPQPAAVEEGSGVLLPRWCAIAFLGLVANRVPGILTGQGAHVDSNVR